MKQNLLDLLKLNDKNPRKISNQQFERLKESLRNFPEMLEKRPIVYDENFVVLGGNMRLRALREVAQEGLNVKDEYFKLAEGWSEEQKREFVIKDNIELGEWDKSVLGEEWADLPLEDWGIDARGWRTDDVEQDEPPALAEECESKLGEVYQVGLHRVMCGDATKTEDVEKLMNGRKASMCFTDPPYNVNYGASTKDTPRGNNKKILNDKMTDGQFDLFLEQSIKDILKFTDGACYICMSSSEMGSLQDAFKASGGHWSTFIIWAKNTFTIGRSDYQRQYEPMLYGWREGVKDRYWCGDRGQGDVWNFDKPVSSKLHPTMKPLALIARAINNSSRRGGIVLDLFGGSGSTLIASEQLGRTCFMLELDPHYVDVIRKRYANLIGKGEEWQKVTPKI